MTRFPSRPRQRACGTGIGCHFDAAVHELAGMRGDRFQDLYHFTVGGPAEDPRLQSLPGYPGRSA